MTTPESLIARIEHLLKAFQNDDLKPFVSGFIDSAPLGAIEDGQYGDPMQSDKPDFVQKDDQGWA